MKRMGTFTEVQFDDVDEFLDFIYKGNSCKMELEGTYILRANSFCDREDGFEGILCFGTESEEPMGLRDLIDEGELEDLVKYGDIVGIEEK